MSTATIDTDYRAQGLEPRALDVELIQSNIRKHVYLVSVTMGFWPGLYKLGGAKVTVDGEATNADRITQPRLKLWESSERLKEIRGQLGALNGERNEIVNHYSEPSSIQGVRIIPKAQMGNLLYELVGKVDPQTNLPVFDDERDVIRHSKEADRSEQSISYRLNELTRMIVSRWNDLVGEMQRNIPENEWRRVSSKIPDVNSIGRCFHLDIGRVEIAERRLENFTSDELRQYESLLSDCAARQADSIVERMFDGPRQTLVEAVTNLNELIMRDGNVTERSFGPVREAIGKLRMFNFLADPALTARIDSLENLMNNTTASELDRQTATTSGFIDAINTVREAARSEVARNDSLARFGRPMRFIDTLNG